LFLGALLGVAQAAPTTTEFRPPPDDTFAWALLHLPERVVEVAATPIALLIAGVEKYRLDRRIYDLLTNEDRTAIVTPVVTYSTTDGPGGGVAFRHTNLFGNDERLRLLAAVRSNRDWQALATFDTDVLALGDRHLWLGADADENRNERWFGLGGDTTESDERVIRVRAVDARASLGLLPGRAPLTALILEGSFHHRAIGNGEDPSIPGVTDEPGVPLPPGYGEALDFPEGALRLVHDTRDSDGRTTRGVLYTLDGSATTDVNGAAESDVRGLASATWYVPVAPRARTLVIGAEAAATAPLRSGDQVPLHRLVTLGAGHGLRGYRPGRFRGRYGWNGTVEYRYPLWEYMSTGTGMSADFFGDVGRVAQTPADLFATPIRWSAGGGLRFESASALVFAFEIGFSPEGTQVVGGLGLAP
jgi:hypothetical protein